MAVQAKHLAVQCEVIQRPFGSDHNFIQIKRLGHKIIGTQADCFDGAVARTVRGDYDHGDRGQLRVTAEMLQELLASDSGHFPITENQVRRFGAQQIDCGSPVIRFQNGISTSSQNLRQCFAQVRFIVDNKNGGRHFCGSDSVR